MLSERQRRPVTGPGDRDTVFHLDLILGNAEGMSRKLDDLKADRATGH